MVSCPSNSAGAPYCQCIDGSQGTLSWSPATTSFTGSCSLLACPAGGAGTPCQCAIGYSGSLSWVSSVQQYSGSCSLVLCPSGAVGTPCQCDLYYSGTVGWSTISQSYAGSCAVAACPAYASGVPCTCNSGYSGSLTWNTVPRTYLGSCSLVSCPAFATGAPSCSCPAGYTSTLAWNSGSQTWSGSCTPVPCPSGSAGTNVPSGCTCTVGLGTITATNIAPNYYSGTCGRNAVSGSYAVFSAANGILVPGDVVTETNNYGAFSFNIGAGVTRIQVYMKAADGSRSNSNNGGSAASGTFSMTSTFWVAQGYSRFYIISGQSGQASSGGSTPLYTAFNGGGAGTDWG